MTSLNIVDGSFKRVTKFTIKTLPSLETIEIGDDCFKSIMNDVGFNTLPELISLKIGRNSFYDETNDQPIDKLFQVYNDYNLLSIEIGEYSFCKFAKPISLSYVPSLQNLTIGSIENESNNFMNASDFSISSIIQLYNRLIPRSSET